MSKIKKIIHDNEEKYIRFLAKLVAFISSCQHILANPSPITFENKLFFMILYAIAKRVNLSYNLYKRQCVQSM